MTSREANGSEGLKSGPEFARILGLWPLPRGAWITLSTVALLYAGHLLYGALVSDTALLINSIAAALVLGLVFTPGARAELAKLKGLWPPAIAFGLVILVALWTLTPWVPGGPHPVWSFVGMGPGASTIDRSSTTVETIKLLGLGCFFLLGAAGGARDDRARFALRAMIIIGVIFAIWAVALAVSTAADPKSGHRLEADFTNANTAGSFFAILLMLSATEFARTLRSNRPGDRLSALPVGAATLLFATCLLDSASRGAVLALAGGGLVYFTVRWLGGELKATRALVFGLLAIVALAGLAAISGDRLIDRVFHSHEASILRGDIWSLHWQAFLDSPLLGYGLGTAESVNKTLLNVSNYDALWNIRAILNVYLQWLEEAGVLGALPMFACIALVILATLRGTLRRSRMTGYLAGLLSVDAIFLIHGASDFALEVPSIAAMWAWLLGLQFSLAQGTSAR